MQDRDPAGRVSSAPDLHGFAVGGHQQTAIARLAAALRIEQRPVEADAFVRGGNNAPFRLGQIGIGFEQLDGRRRDHAFLMCLPMNSTMRANMSPDLERSGECPVWRSMSMYSRAISPPAFL